MTGFVAAPLQSALFARLSTETSLSAVDVFDAPEPGPLPATYILIGEEKVRDVSGQNAPQFQHDLKVQIVTQSGGFAQIKLLAAAVNLALSPALSVAGQSVQAQFVKAEAKILGNGATRRVELSYRAFICA